MSNDRHAPVPGNDCSGLHGDGGAGLLLYPDVLVLFFSSSLNLANDNTRLASVRVDVCRYVPGRVT